MNMKVKALTIGIASYQNFKARTLAIARGEYKPSKDEPKIWFSSIESLAQVLSTKNQMLLEIIAKEHPESITELAKLSGREKSNLSRTLKTMERYGLVELRPGEGKEIIPFAPYDHFKVECDVFRTYKI
jgi:predicted transcriptional regulator